LLRSQLLGFSHLVSEKKGKGEKGNTGSLDTTSQQRPTPPLPSPMRRREKRGRRHHSSLLSGLLLNSETLRGQGGGKEWPHYVIPPLCVDFSFCFPFLDPLFLPSLLHARKKGTSCQAQFLFEALARGEEKKGKGRGVLVNLLFRCTGGKGGEGENFLFLRVLRRRDPPRKKGGEGGKNRDCWNGSFSSHTSSLTEGKEKEKGGKLLLPLSSTPREGRRGGGKHR